MKREKSEFEKLITERFEQAVFEKNNYEEVGMYYDLSNMQGVCYESEMLAYLKAHPNATLKEVYDFDTQLLIKYYPDGFDGTAKE